MAEILIIEDDESLASSLRHSLEVSGEHVETTSSSTYGLAQAQERSFDTVITDLQMPKPDGLEVVRRLHQARPQLPVILMTAHHTTDVAIEAMKQGAYDYVLKPIEQFDQFVDLVKKAVETSRLRSEPVAMGDAPSDKVALVGKTAEMQRVYKDIGRLAAMPVTVLIRGETGTGKELVARAIYQHGNRQQKPFIIVNCAAIPDNLLESELFGHEAGAFTDAKTRRIGRFEQAHEGTIFLDEIGDVSLGTQAKLLRVLQEKTIQRLGGREIINVDVRVIAATHQNLEQAITRKEFREDLYYRLNVAVIHLPPLRERREDVPALVNYFLRRHGRELKLTSAAIAPAALDLLQQSDWPGNVRELENVIRRALVRSHSGNVTLDVLREELVAASPRVADSGQSFKDYIAALLKRAQSGEINNVDALLSSEVERELFSQAYALAGGDQTKAAAWLGISRPTMREKLLRYKILPGKETSS